LPKGGGPGGTAPRGCTLNGRCGTFRDCFRTCAEPSGSVGAALRGRPARRRGDHTGSPLRRRAGQAARPAGHGAYGTVPDLSVTYFHFAM
jgi:hypothetical protein